MMVNYVRKNTHHKPMEWMDEGIVINQKILGDSYFITTLLTLEHGRHKGLVKQRKTSIFLGAQIHVQWKSRLEDNLGLFLFDQPYGHIMGLLDHSAALMVVNIMCLMCGTLLPERVGFPGIYFSFLETLAALGTPKGLKAYDCFERIILEDLGYHEAPYVQNKKSCLRHHIQALQDRYSVFIQHWPQAKRLHKARADFMALIEASL